VSKLNGDKARFNKERRKKALWRQRLRETRNAAKAASGTGAAAKAGTPERG
jgi:hypothetical protein